MGAAQKIKVNKRIYERHPVAVAAKIRPVGGKEWSGAFLHNLSKGGTLLESELGCFVGQMIEILIEKEKGQKPHQIMATIVWKKDGKYGVNFL